LIEPRCLQPDAFTVYAAKAVIRRDKHLGARLKPTNNCHYLRVDDALEVLLIKECQRAGRHFAAVWQGLNRDLVQVLVTEFKNVDFEITSPIPNRLACARAIWGNDIHLPCVVELPLECFLEVDVFSLPRPERGRFCPCRQCPTRHFRRRREKRRSRILLKYLHPLQQHRPEHLVPDVVPHSIEDEDYSLLKLSTPIWLDTPMEELAGQANFAVTGKP